MHQKRNLLKKEYSGPCSRSLFLVSMRNVCSLKYQSEILQLWAKSQVVMIWCSRFVCIANSSDKSVWTVILLHLKLLPSPLGHMGLKNTSYWHIEAVWETSISIWVPNLRNPTNTFQIFFFQYHFNRKYIEVAINDFTKHLIILKWLKIQKYRKKNKTMRQRDRSKRRN